MAQTEILFPYKKKHELLFAKEKNTALIREWGQRLTEAGWLSDAIDCFAAAGDTDGLQRLRQMAMDQGDIFLFRRCLAEEKREASPEEWAALGRRAESLGKLRFAREAFRIAGDRKALDRIDALLAPPLQPPAEATAGSEPAGSVPSVG